MSQYVSDRKVDEVFLKSDSQDGKRCAADLIMLRAAVRRVHAAEDAVANGPVGSGWGLYELDEARDALRAEMASIDGNGNGGAS